MNKKSRTQNSKKNFIVGVISLIITTAISFVSRTVFIRYLSTEYLGVNGLYGNILSLLALSELGLTNVATFSLYKPIANNDERQIKKLINFYSKMYNYIFVFMLVGGLLLVPFLKYIINSDLSTNELIIFYVIYLFSSSVSYLAISKQLLINADQRYYITKRAGTISHVLQNTIQILILIFTKNYYLYLITQCVCTVMLNVYLVKKANKLYPFIKQNEENLVLSKKEKKDIFNKQKDTFVYRICVIIVNSTDNIFISKLVSTAAVGFYSNYSMIVTVLSNFINTIISSVTSSIGNLNAQSSNEKIIDMFYKLLFIMQWIVSFFSACLIILFNDFISIWIGKDYMFSTQTVITIVAYFYLSNIVNPVWMFRETLGLFDKVKKIMFATAALNIILSYVLGKTIGISGIILATLLSKLLTTVWYEPVILLKNKLNASVFKYYFIQIGYISLFLITLCISYLFTKSLVVNNFFTFIIKGCAITFVYNLIYILVFCRSGKFKYFFNQLSMKKK